MPTEIDEILVPPQSVEPLDVRQWDDDGTGQGQRHMGNLVGTLLASAARTTNINGAAMVNPNHRGLVLYVNITAFSGTSPTIQLRVNAIDPITGTPIALYLSAATAAAAGEFVWILYPLGGAWGGSSTNLVAVNAMLTRTWSVDVIIAGTTPSITFSLGYSLLG